MQIIVRGRLWQKIKCGIPERHKMTISLCGSELGIRASRADGHTYLEGILSYFDETTLLSLSSDKRTRSLAFWRQRALCACLLNSIIEDPPSRCCTCKRTRTIQLVWIKLHFCSKLAPMNNSSNGALTPDCESASDGRTTDVRVWEEWFLKNAKRIRYEIGLLL